MGLAASQARFLCITARKADCEYRSTELAQQKLDITKQMSDISNQYAQAMNATKLVWSHEGLAADCAMTYGLMMLPSAANDFNPYLITSPSGAIVLNTEYAAAARAAGISKAGGVGSQESRDKFISVLAHQGLLTDETAKAITIYDYDVSNNNGKLECINGSTSTGGVSWNSWAGLGSTPLNKGGSVSIMTLADLTLSESIGQQPIDWALLGVTDPAKQMTKLQYETEKDRLNKLVKDVNTDKPITEDILKELQRIRNEKYDKYSDNGKNDLNEEQNKELKALDELIEVAKRYYTLNDKDKTAIKTKVSDYIKDRYDAHCDTKNIDGTTSEKSIILLGDNDELLSTIDASVNTKGNRLGAEGTTYSIVENGLINHNKTELEEMTIGDIINKNIVLMSNGENLEDFRKNVLRLFDSMVEKLGYSSTKDMYGQGLYVDEYSKMALQFAYDMVTKTFLDTKEAVTSGSSTNATSMTDNSAYANAVEYNRLSKVGYNAVSLTNMMSAFLTYYENALSGVNSPYVVGKSLKSGYYVTDDPSYQYVMYQSNDVVSEVDKKTADFFDQLYNNILEHGWREDAAIDDSEYLESKLKDGRYSMSSLNPDGYYYQTRYNETGYILEVSDKDAIERAEAEFMAMKAELTLKEDSIDIKTKKLDAEISVLSNEYIPLIAPHVVLSLANPPPRGSDNLLISSKETLVKSTKAKQTA